MSAIHNNLRNLCRDAARFGQMLTGYLDQVGYSNNGEHDINTADATIESAGGWQDATRDRLNNNTQARATITRVGTASTYDFRRIYGRGLLDGPYRLCVVNVVESVAAWQAATIRLRIQVNAGSGTGAVTDLYRQALAYAIISGYLNAAGSNTGRSINRLAFDNGTGGAAWTHITASHSISGYGAGQVEFSGSAISNNAITLTRVRAYNSSLGVDSHYAQRTGLDETVLAGQLVQVEATFSHG